MEGLMWIDIMMLALLARVLALVSMIAFIISKYRIFMKAGEKGWKSFIPIYGDIIYFKIVGFSPYAFLIFLFLLIPIPSIRIITILIIIMGGQIYFYNKLAKAFGKSKGFVTGLFFLNSIFLMILAFDKSEYVGEYSSKNSKITE